MYFNCGSLILAKGFKVGDEVFFAGDLSRDGCWAEYVAIDHRICALKPKNVDHLTAASMPLTTLTAWETFEDKFHIPVPAPGSAAEKKNASKSVLIIAGAGGVGSVAIQLAKKVFKIGKVITTAGRKDSHDWCVKMGADLVLDRSKDWKTQLTENGIKGVDYIFACSSPDDILAELVDISNPWGHICSIVPPHKPYNVGILFGKCISLSLEYMSARPSHNFEQERQGEIFATFAKYVEDGTIQPWVGTTYDKLSIENVKAAHVLQQSGTAIGKITLNAVF